MDNIFKIWHGDAKTLALIFTTKPGNGRFDFTGVGDVKVRIPLTQGQSPIYKEYTISNSGGVMVDPASPLLGRVLVTIPASDSVNFNAAEAQDIETVVIPSSGLPFTVVFKRALYVYKSITETT